MIARNSAYLIAMGIAVMGASVYAADDVTVISTPTTTSTHSDKTADSDGTPVIHKSVHKKKAAPSVVVSTPAPTPPPAPAPAPIAHLPPPVEPIVVSKAPSTSVAPQSPIGLSKAAPPPIIITVPANKVLAATTTPAASTSSTTPAAAVPTVETGLPVARYPGMGAPIKGVSTYSPLPNMSSGKPGSPAHLPYFASALPNSVIPLTSTTPGIYSTPNRTASASTDNFVFTNYSKKTKNSYPWKSRILTTIFWIGEGATPISSTTNVQSSWDEDWRANNHGTDSPNDRNGYASGSHASTLNPFYVALPFNDLAYPDKARRWLPAGWYRRPKDGKQVSACKDHWVMIKNNKGDVCYAQWEDVGPLRYDHAEYVFGDEAPIGLGSDHAGLDVSPAVADYLNINDRNRFTSWRFVDDEDVHPGPWLKLDEQAVIFTALHQLKNSKPSSLPIQKASEPIDDRSNVDSNKKKVSASKG